MDLKGISLYCLCEIESRFSFYLHNQVMAIIYLYNIIPSLEKQTEELSIKTGLLIPAYSTCILMIWYTIYVFPFPDLNLNICQPTSSIIDNQAFGKFI